MGELLAAAGLALGALLVLPVYRPDRRRLLSLRQQPPQVTRASPGRGSAPVAAGGDDRRQGTSRRGPLGPGPASARTGAPTAGAATDGAPGPGRPRQGWLRPLLFAGLAGGAGLLLFGGPSSVVGLTGAGLAAVLSGVAVGRAGGGRDRRRERQRREQLPLALDLVAACLRAGQPTATALSVVARSWDGALTDDLATVAALLGLGARPAVAWAEAIDDPVLGPAAAAAVRVGDSGAALARTFVLLAAEARAAAGDQAEAVARRVGVLVLAPLGLCFLPAFVCLGVVPVVFGIATAVLG